MANFTRYYVTYKDGDGSLSSKTRTMSLAEANEMSKRFRFNGYTDVRVVNANAPKPAEGYDANWRIVP
jgi:hypothetical protein